MHILTDADVRAHLTPAEAVRVMESVFMARAAGQTAGAPRWELPYPGGRLTLTVGAVPEGVGFRAYVRGNYAHDDQLVAVWDRETGALKGLIVGEALGVLRTGAIGGAAVNALAPQAAHSLAVIGTGRQALSQVAAIAAVRPLTEIRAYSRTPENRADFCARVAAQFPHITVINAESAETAVRGAQIVVGATTSKTPVIQAEWLLADVHISTLGTKGRQVREVDEAVVAAAAWVVTDSPEQTRNYPDGTILDGTDQHLHDLADILQAKTPRPAGLSLFLSAGLAGTEVALAAYLIEKLR